MWSCFKAQVLSFTLDYFVITKTIVLFHKIFKLHSSENVDPQILRKELIGGVLQNCMHILIFICTSTVTERLPIDIKLRLWRSCCIYYKLLMQLGYISVLLLYTDMLRSNPAGFIRITNPAFVCREHT